MTWHELAALAALLTLFKMCAVVESIQHTLEERPTVTVPYRG